MQPLHNPQLLTGTTTPSMVNKSGSFEQDELVLSTTIILSLILVTAILGNGLVLYTFYKQPTLQKVCYYPIISLAIADILCAFFSMPAYIAKKHTPGGWSAAVTCNVFRFTYFFTAYASVLTLTIISIERLIVTKMSVKRNAWLTKSTVIIALVISWLDAALVSILPFFWREKDNDKCTFNPTPAWSIMVILANVCFPFSIMVYCHINTALFAIRYNRKKRKEKAKVHDQMCKLFPEEMAQIIDKENFKNQEKEFEKRERRITLVFAIVVLVFAICWAPSSFYFLIKMVCPQRLRPVFEHEQVLKAIVKLLTFINSSLNPWISLLLHRPFKNGFYRTLRGRRQAEGNTETSL